MLGVRREGVTEVAGVLHKTGLIDYRRGHIHGDRSRRLERRTCECYCGRQEGIRPAVATIGAS